MFLRLSVSHRLSAAELPLEAGTYKAATMSQRMDLLEVERKKNFLGFQDRSFSFCFIRC